MKLSSFSSLYSAEYNIQSIFAMDQFWNEKQQFNMNNARPTDALLLFIGCGAKYLYSKTNDSIMIEKGNLFYIPAGSTYSWTFLDSDPKAVSTILFEFVLTDDGGNKIEIGDKAKIIDISGYNLYEELFRNIVAEFSRPVMSTAKVKSAAYNILGALSGEGRVGNTNNVKLQSIHKGISYLESDPNQTKSIKDIADMCNMSVGYFERLFKEYSGITPTLYRIQKKMQRAKLLLSNETLNIDQIALRLGFEDTAYFCRVFKKQNGCTPTEYRQK